jgi:hypothetical protein
MVSRKRQTRDLSKASENSDKPDNRRASPASRSWLHTHRSRSWARYRLFRTNVTIEATLRLRLTRPERRRDHCQLRAPDRIWCSGFSACCARSTTRSTFCLVLSGLSLRSGFPELRCLTKMTLASGRPRLRIWRLGIRPDCPLSAPTVGATTLRLACALAEQPRTSLGLDPRVWRRELGT